MSVKSHAPLRVVVLGLSITSSGPWFHNLNLGAVWTAPDHFLGDYPRIKWQRFAHAIPEDLRGQTVLDIGCNAGFFSIEMKRRGASRGRGGGESGCLRGCGWSCLALG